MRTFVATAILLVATPAIAQEEQFNLVCSGELTTNEDGHRETEEYTQTLRVDLDGGRWCADHCEVVHSIDRVSPTEITLQSYDTDGPGVRLIVLSFVNRVTGRHYSAAIATPGGEVAPVTGFRREGTCEKVAFSGLPPSPTKF